MEQLNFRPAGKDNLNDLLHLSLYPEQRTFVEPVRECLEEAAGDARWHPMGIYLGDCLIGFTMYGKFSDGRPVSRVWLDRILIDKRYQHCGYGKSAILALIKRLREEYPGYHAVYLSVFDDNPVAIRLYRELGFRFTGELDTGGEKIMVLD